MSGGGHGKRRAKHEEHEEHVNHERWLVSYADMLTVLVALFIVLFALSQVDAVKFAQFKAGLTDGASASNLVLPGNDGINQVDNGEDPIDLMPLAGGDPMQEMSVQQVLDQAQKKANQSDLDAAQAEVAQYRDVEEELDNALTAQGKENQVTYRITSEGLVIGLVADNVFFANGSADIQPVGLQVLDVIGPTLAALPNDIAVQGHTNSLPLSSTVRFRDNWDLSSSRANSVLTRFIAANGVSDQRLSSTGFGSARPLYPDSDPRALAGNRRVDLVVASPSSEAVKALLPQVAAGTPTTGPDEVQPPAADPAPAEAPAAPVVDPGLAGPVEVAQVSTTENTAEQAVAEHADTTPEGH
ncbi:flagellar motor protein MotB [Kineococcus rubinsiae]|uniref:flagellar motor protein MotB n=1 Tax=Kineococcus rubinsiae TaxID=2609562 RepID=UPI001431A376|nr:flagellar motor protein MotB [Kineococcus rubinsiae]NIZ92310.1 flagellar motor protein MotB [Kineococcus rubinsiae]